MTNTGLNELMREETILDPMVLDWGKTNSRFHACGTVKAAVLEGNPGCVNLVASSVYDSKPEASRQPKLPVQKIQRPPLGIPTG